MEYVALCGDEFKWVYWNSIYNFRDSRLIRTETFDLVLYLSGCRNEIRTLENVISSILTQDRSKPVICQISGLLHHALGLIGHDVDYDVRAKAWVVSSFRGQVAYPKIFETHFLEKRGYLTISWAPRLLQYDSERHSKGVSETLPNLQSDTLGSQDNMKVNIPRNLVQAQKLVVGLVYKEYTVTTTLDRSFGVVVVCH